jgi:hypothetical protein
MAYLMGPFYILSIAFPRDVISINVYKFVST